jgi:hypothetical protein
VAAYRFLDHPDIGVQEMLSGHTHATLERIRAQAVVLLVQDPTFLQDGTTQPKAGMGPGKLNTRDEYLRHPTVAFPPERVNVGGVGMPVWQRPDQPVAQQRKSKPSAEKARSRWLEGSQYACKVKQACPATLVGNMADREGDIQEWCVDAMAGSPANGQRVSCAPSVIGALLQGPRRAMYGQSCRRRPPWGHSPSHWLASLSGRPDSSPSR